MRKISRGLIGRRVRVRGERGIWKISEVYPDSFVVGSLSRGHFASMPRGDVRFIRQDYTK